LSHGSAQWNEASSGFRASVERYFTEHGHDPASERVRSTVSTNTELVPRRAENIVQLVRELAGVPSIADARIVEAGSGFGALAGYIAWRYRPKRLLAIDVRADYIESARESATALGVGDLLSYQVADMRDFAGMADASADLVIVNNAFIYLPTGDDMQHCLEALRRVVAPGGVVLFYHANKWALREPFTKDPIVHLVPAWAARHISGFTGWRHNHGRVRLLSPLEMRRRLRRAGFSDIRIGGYGEGGLVTGRNAYFKRFYAATGRRS
jgi:SAM-dependent methyltransferase